MKASVLHCRQTTQEVRAEFAAGVAGLQALLIEKIMRRTPKEHRALFEQWKDSFLRCELDSHKLLQELLDRIK